MNANDMVWVRLTPLGERVHTEHWAKYGIENPASNQVEGGWRGFQLWDLMNVFGSVMMVGMDSPFVENVIRVVEVDPICPGREGKQGHTFPEVNRKSGNLTIRSYDPCIWCQGQRAEIVGVLVGKPG